MHGKLNDVAGYLFKASINKCKMKNISEKISHFFTFQIANRVLMGVGNLLSPFSVVSTKPVIPNSEFKWTSLLEENWEVILSEVIPLLEKQDSLPNIQDIQPAESILSMDNNWKTFFLQGFGHKADRNRIMCPQTSVILDQIPGLLTAFFSILQPGKHIPAHKGIFKGIVRTHLGLVIPKRGECKMRVDNEEVYWEAGKVVFFDDTYNHEVWNNTDEIRIVLLIDTPRHYKYKLIDKINQFIINGITNSIYVKEALKKNEDWENVYYKVLA